MNGTRRLPIFDAAVKVFAEKGFARATVEEIARQAGIAKGTIYNNYKSKRSFFSRFWRKESTGWRPP